MHGPTFDGLAKNLLECSLARPTTVSGYYTLLGHCCRGGLGNMPVRAIARRHVEAALAAARDRGLGSKSLRNLLQFIKLVLKEAGSRAADGIRVRVPEPDVRPMTHEEVAQFTQALSGRDEDAALFILLRTGLRLGELLALQRNDYDVERAVLHVRRSTNGPTKSGKGRSVDVPDDAARLLTHACALHRGSIFPLCDRTLRRSMERACQRAGIPQFRVHDLRHTRATHQLLAGVPVAYVSEQLGHSSPSYTIRVYGHMGAASESQRRKWANA